MNSIYRGRKKKASCYSMYGILAIMVLWVLVCIVPAVALPSGPTIVFNSTTNVTPRTAAQITTAGGSFTTIVLNATTQTLRWKAYVGNVSGKLILEDANTKSIFDWTVTSVTGEVYATRNSSVDWSTIACANSSTIASEQSMLNISAANPDSINNTFAPRVHRRFYTGAVLIQNSTCPSIATYVNGTAQLTTEGAVFQEILLQDAQTRMVYVSLINQSATGYNNNKFDFQMIVAENEFQASPSTYYMYVELI